VIEERIDVAGGAQARGEDLAPYCPVEPLRRIIEEPQRGVPAVARDTTLAGQVELAVQKIPTTHSLLLGDARHLDDLPDESVHLVVTSPPYWTLKEYERGEGQLGYVDDYEEFNNELARVWAQCYRLLVPGGRLVVNVGDVCLPRRKVGRHVVFPLHATIIERCRAIGFDNLNPIVWHKIANATFEAGGGSILGKPYEPNGIVKNDIEWILFQRKSGGYRAPTLATRTLSTIPTERHQLWFQNVWTLGGALSNGHPAPYPVELAARLIRMFSFVGDMVMDPFSGTASTSVAAGTWGRDSIGVEVQPLYHQMGVRRLRELANERDQLDLFD